MTNEETSPEPLAGSKTARLGLISLGHLCIVLAVIGALLPVMPTTVFVIAAAWCYARGSPRFHQWLLSTRTFGPLVRNWEQNRSMTRRAKTIAIGMIVLTFSLTIGLAIHLVWARAMLAVLGAGLIAMIVRIRTA